jgi:hypothetical protein
MHASWIPLTLFMQTWILGGSLYQPISLRLIDSLNDRSDTERNGAPAFVHVSGTTTFHSDGSREKKPSVFLNKANILLVATEDGNTSRGIGAEVGPKRYPFMHKIPIQVLVQLPPYTIIGDAHCVSGQLVQDLLDTKSIFIPMTNVRIRTQGHKSWRTAHFAAVNKAQIHSFQPN